MLDEKDIQQIGQAVEERLIPKLEESLIPKLEERLIPKLEESMIPKIEERLMPKIAAEIDKSFEEKVMPRLGVEIDKAFDERLMPKIGRFIDGTIMPRIAIEMGKVIDENVIPAIDELREEVDKMRAVMVTKSYLDDKLADLKGDFVAKLRKEDGKTDHLIGILKKKEILSKQEAQEFKEYQIFPKLEKV